MKMVRFLILLVCLETFPFFLWGWLAEPLSHPRRHASASVDQSPTRTPSFDALSLFVVQILG